MPDEYIFTRLEEQEEFERLNKTGAAFNWLTQGRLAALGLGTGSVCLEAGVGAGSMARWLSDQVGPTGRIVGVDLDARFFPACQRPNIELQQHDLRTIEFPDETFDFIHARLLLLHLQPNDRAQLAANFHRWLKPGGWLVVGDCAFGVHTSTEGRLAPLLDKLVDGAQQHADFNLGDKMPALLADSGFRSVESVLTYTHYTPPTLNSGYGDTNDAYAVAGIAAVRKFVVPSGAATDADFDQVTADINTGQITSGVGITVTWGTK